jgi:tetratricopeptide (TPR) repeat protein
MDKPPPGYVPGISRGDTGFITRLDVGPMNIDPRLNNLKTTNNYRNGNQNRNMGENSDMPRPMDSGEFDRWSGYSMNIFRSSKYTNDDKGKFNSFNLIIIEADETYAKIDDFMAERSDGFAKPKIRATKSVGLSALKNGFSKKSTKKLNFISPSDVNRNSFKSVKEVTQNDYMNLLSKRSEPDKTESESGVDFWNRVNTVTNERVQGQKTDISQLFKREKSKLKMISESEWESLPDAHVKRANKKAREKATPVPDQFIVGSLFNTPGNRPFAQNFGNARTGLMMSYLDGKLDSTRGTDSLALIRGGTFGKKSVLFGEGGLRSAIKLNRDESQSGEIKTIGKQNQIDKNGYLTKLNTQTLIRADHNIQDIKKARMLLKSIRETDPLNEQGYLGGARVEVIDGKEEIARALLKKGIQKIPTSEDIWCEFIRLLPSSKKKLNKKNIQEGYLGKAKDEIVSGKLRTSLTESGRGTMSKLTLLPDAGSLLPSSGSLSFDTSSNSNLKIKYVQMALRNVPKSAKLWKIYYRLMKEHKKGREALKKALKHCTSDIFLWKESVNTALDDEEKREILRKAVQSLPKCLDFWIALAKLSDYEAAKNVLRQANSTFDKSELKIYVNGAMLEEANVNLELTSETIFEMSVVDLKQNKNQSKPFLQSVTSQFPDLLKKKTKISKKLRKLIMKGFKKNLDINNKILNKEVWMQEASQCEASGYPLCAITIMDMIFQYDFGGLEEVLLSFFQDEEIDFIELTHDEYSGKSKTKNLLQRALSRVHEIRDKYIENLSQEAKNLEQEQLFILIEKIMFYGEKLMRRFAPFIAFGNQKIGCELFWMNNSTQFQKIRQQILEKYPDQHVLDSKAKEYLSQKSLQISSQSHSFVDKLLMFYIKKQKMSLVVSLMDKFSIDYMNLLEFHKNNILTLERLYYSDRIDEFSFRSLIEFQFEVNFEMVNDSKCQEYLVSSFLGYASTETSREKTIILMKTASKLMDSMFFSAKLLEQRLELDIRRDKKNGCALALNILNQVCKTIAKRYKKKTQDASKPFEITFKDLSGQKDKRVKISKPEARFFIILADILELTGKSSTAKKSLEHGLRLFPNNLGIHIALLKYLYKHKSYAEARVQFEKTSRRFSSSERLYLEILPFEKMNRNEYSNLLSKAKKNCPFSGDIAILNVANDSSSNKKILALDCAKKFPNCVEIILFIAKLFYKEGKLAKTKKWVMSAWEAAPCNLDLLAFLYILYEKQSDSQIEMKLLLSKVAKIRNAEGGLTKRIWEQVRFELSSVQPIKPLFFEVVKQFKQILEDEDS